MKNSWQRIILAGLTAMLLIAGTFSLAKAAVFWPFDEEVRITDEAPVQLRNLFAFGQKIEIDADIIHKDLFVIGMIVNISSEVENNLYVGGQDIFIEGAVGGNIFALGNTLRISGVVDGDIFAMGSTIVLEEDAMVHGEIFAGTHVFRLNGQVMDDVSVNCNSAEISGTVLGRFSLKAREKVEIFEGALIQKLFYESPEEAFIAEGAEVRKISYTVLKPTDKPVRDTEFLKGLIRGMAVVDWLASILLGFILIILLRKPTLDIMDNAVRKFGISTAFGLTFFIGVPLAILILLLLIVGYKLALVAGIFAFFIWSLSSTLAGILVGVLLQYWIVRPRKELSAYINWISVLLGVSIFKLLLLLPVLGWLVRLLLVCAVIGAILMCIGSSLKSSAPKSKVEASTHTPE